MIGPEHKKRLLALRHASTDTLESELRQCAKGLKNGYLDMMSFSARFGMADACLFLIDKIKCGKPIETLLSGMISAVRGGHANIVCLLLDRVETDERRSILDMFARVRLKFCKRKMEQIFGHEFWARYTTSDLKLRLQALHFLFSSTPCAFVIHKYAPCLKLRAEDIQRNINFIFRYAYWHDIPSRLYPGTKEAVVQSICEIGVLDELIEEVRGYMQSIEVLAKMGFPIEYLVESMNMSTYDLLHIDGYEVPFSVRAPDDSSIHASNIRTWDGEPVPRLQHPLVSDGFFDEYNAEVDAFNANLEENSLKMRWDLFDSLVADYEIQEAMEIDIEWTEGMKYQLLRAERYILHDCDFYERCFQNGLSVNLHEWVVFGCRGAIPCRMIELWPVRQEDIDSAKRVCDMHDIPQTKANIQAIESRAHPVQVCKDTTVRTLRSSLPEVLARMVGGYISMDGVYVK